MLQEVPGEFAALPAGAIPHRASAVYTLWRR